MPKIRPIRGGPNEGNCVRNILGQSGESHSFPQPHKDLRILRAVYTPSAGQQGYEVTPQADAALFDLERLAAVVACD